MFNFDQSPDRITWITWKDQVTPSMPHWAKCPTWSQVAHKKHEKTKTNEPNQLPQSKAEQCCWIWCWNHQHHQHLPANVWSDHHDSDYSDHDWLVVWNMFFHILGEIFPTDFHIFQRARYTTNQMIFFGPMSLNQPDVFSMKVAIPGHTASLMSSCWWHHIP